MDPRARWVPPLGPVGTPDPMGNSTKGDLYTYIHLHFQRECPVSENDTLDSIYKNFMYPEGIKAMSEAVNLVAEGKAPKIIQPEEGASYDAFLNKPELCKINLEQTAERIHNFIRGLDSVPGAWCVLEGKETKLFGSKMMEAAAANKPKDSDPEVKIDGAARTGRITKDGLCITGR